MNLKLLIASLVPLLLSAGSVFADDLPEIRIVTSGMEVIEIYENLDYWGKLEPREIVSVPPLLVVATTPQWRKDAAAMTVADKKELFYRSLLPLVLYANEAIESKRARLQEIVESLGAGQVTDEASAGFLLDLGIRYKLISSEGDQEPVLPQGESLTALVNGLLSRVDTIPASLALGQGAYESGYGTSRFALEGHSYFGQWTYGGKGMAPKEKRASKGDYGVAAYAWPLDSVHSYMMNLNTHRAYSELRAKRAQLRAAGKPVTGMALAETLTHYSERGEEYVKTLTGMMRVNELYAADQAALRQEEPVLIVDAFDEEHAEAVSRELSELRSSGKLADLILSMGVRYGHVESGK
jgi:Bax protein